MTPEGEKGVKHVRCGGFEREEGWRWDSAERMDFAGERG